MRRNNVPVYSGGRRRADQIRTCLNLIAQYRSGIGMERSKAAVVRVIDQALTGDELEMLQSYYNDGATQRRIAAQTGLTQSGVSRAIYRAGRKLEWALPVLGL